jgi:hypothetical protein
VSGLELSSILASGAVTSTRFESESGTHGHFDDHGLMHEYDDDDTFDSRLLVRSVMQGVLVYT